jgi:hypothetical protein
MAYGANDVPYMITGPFENGEQAKQAALACQALDREIVFTIAGSEPWSIRDVPSPK